MSGLIDSLASAARALEAQQLGLSVAGQNIANVNTPGYARRAVVLESVPGTGPLSAGNGVAVTTITAARDLLLARRLQKERPAEQRQAAVADALSVVETAIGQPGASVDAALGQFYDSFGRLAEVPTSATARQEVVLQAQALAGTFHDMAQRLTSARRDADAGVRASVDQINTLTTRIAAINVSLSGVSSGSSESLSLKDELSVALDSLSGLVGVSAINRPDGGVDLSFGNGHPLVIGATPYKLATDATPDGLATILSEGVDVTGEVTTGYLGGQLAARDTYIPEYLDRLDAMAYALVTSVNDLHEAGADLSGVRGHEFFVPLDSLDPARPTGAASAIALSDAIAANPATIAASQTGAAGDNSVARSLSNLRDTPVLDPVGGTPTVTLSDGWARLVYTVGSDSAAARDEHASRSAIVKQVEALREAVSGVSLDEEAMSMMKFQRAYEANARFFRAVGDSLDTLMQALR